MTPLRRPATAEGLFLAVMHAFAARFDQHAILKGGIALRLLESPRATTDIDYVFVPFESKREIKADVEAALRGIDGAAVEVRLHSKMLRAAVQVDGARIQVEVTVAPQCGSVPVATAGLARAHGQPSQVVAVMRFDTALAEKLAAWNERRLLRDLYDCHFLVHRLGAAVDMEALDRRLARVESRIPSLRKRKRMTRGELARELRAAAEALKERDVEAELAPLLPPGETAGLVPRIRAAVSRLADGLEAS
ncbi:MAG: nucleotidyl transferase AbiEii/AbiGii toxin family protein [Vicinamibacteria bacterium]|nr:nucleotidyl transferase AbiEii/AbiGii toxin family protein [Vicinamibacteria bacterium]